MKTSNILKSIVLGTVFLLTITSCKKEEKKNEPTPIEKLYVMEYRGEVTGTNVTGKITYYNPDTEQVVTENFIGTKKSVYFAIKKGTSLTMYVDAQTLVQYTPTATAEIYVDGTKIFSATSSSQMFATAYASGTY